MDQREFEGLVASLKESAKNGSVTAMKWLGDAYYQGVSGKDRNYEAALPYWKCAADHGELSVAFKVGRAYENGDYFAKDYSKALHYYLLAAENGNIDGLFRVGLCYELGRGCAANESKAKQYYEKAALQGQGEAQWCLGRLQYLAREKDGLHWLCCAHLSGIQRATDALNGFIDNGTSSEVIQYQIDLIKKNGINPRNSQKSSASNSGDDNHGCYIATCVYGSYNCPPVWTLRRFRDNTMAETWYGRLFIHMYYAVSPTLVRWLGHTTWFRNWWRKKLDRLVMALQANGVESEPYEDKLW